MEHIDVTCLHRSQQYPLVRFMIDDVCYANIKAASRPVNFSVDLPEGKHTFDIEHYGKNYEKDSDPDTFFQLEELFFNKINFKHIKYHIKQKPILPPWEGLEQPIWDDLRMGFNGTLSFEFEVPIGMWFRKKFNVIDPMVGQETTWEYLETAKAVYEKYNG